MAPVHSTGRRLRRPRPGRLPFASLAAAAVLTVPLAAPATSPSSPAAPLSTTQAAASGWPAFPSVWDGGAPVIDPGPIGPRTGGLGRDPAQAGVAAASEGETATRLPLGAALAVGVERYVRPVPGPITSPFGPRFHPILHYVRNHNGVDMTAACGTPVVAMADGAVTRAAAAGGYGNLVEVSHGTIDGDLVVSRYAHLSVIGVAAGDRVGRGQVIGLAGTTGLSTGCHLHFEVLLNGSYVDPAGVLAGASHEQLIGMAREIRPRTAPVVPPLVPTPTPTAAAPTRTPAPATPTPTPPADDTSTPTPDPTPAPDPTPTPAPTATPTPTPDPTPVPEPTASPSAAPTPTAPPTPTLAATPTRGQSPTPGGGASPTVSA